MAITAWAAKLVANPICFSVNGRTSGRFNTNVPINSHLRN